MQLFVSNLMKAGSSCSKYIQDWLKMYVVNSFKPGVPFMGHMQTE